ncbi:MAG: CGNR zinc finger domain-containing protein [Nocardioides sp.]
MDFVRYAERSAGLVNADLADADAVIAFLDQRAWLHDQVNDRDAAALRRFQRELRPVFEASNDGDEEVVVEQLNALLAKHPVTPYIAGHGDKDGQGPNWHMHVADRQSSVAELLVAESLMGLSTLVCDLGATRLGVCDASPCTDVFVDTSPNQSRRYCSDRCSSRANVAAYRARQKAATGGCGASAASVSKPRD